MENEKEIIRAVSTAGIIGTIAATIRALMAKNEKPAELLRNFLAGVLMAVFLGFLLRDSTMSNFWREIIIGVSAAFITSIWPLIELLVIRVVKKKSNDVVNSNLD